MNSFGGINKETHRAEIAETESQDAANCFFHKGRLGLLGQREGKTFLNSYAYQADISGYVPLLQSNGTQRVQVATNSGDVVQTTTNNTNGFTIYPTGNSAVGQAMTTDTLTLAYPDTSVDLDTTFLAGTSYSQHNSLFVSWGYGIAMTIGTWTSAKKLRLELGIREGTTARYLWTFDWTMQFQHGWALTDMNSAALHNATDAITGMCVRLSWPDDWPDDAAAGDEVVLSNLLMG